MAYATVREDGDNAIRQDEPAPLPWWSLADLGAWLRGYERDDRELDRHMAARMEGTGDWLLSSEAYRKWYAPNEESATSLLWISGK